MRPVCKPETVKKVPKPQAPIQEEKKPMGEKCTVEGCEHVGQKNFRGVCRKHYQDEATRPPRLTKAPTTKKPAEPVVLPPPEVKVRDKVPTMASAEESNKCIVEDMAKYAFNEMLSISILLDEQIGAAIDTGEVDTAVLFEIRTRIGKVLMGRLG